MKLLMVSVGAGRYAVAADAVDQIMNPALDPDFRTDATSGEATHRGQRYRLIDLGEEGGTGAGGGLCLVLARGGAGAIVPVDSAEAIREIPASAIAPLPSFIFAEEQRLFRGIFSDGREARLLVDEGALL